MGDFLRGAFNEAIALGHHWCGEEHVFLYLLTESAVLGVTHDEARDAIVAGIERDGRPAPEEWVGSGCLSAPTYHEVLGRATGFALGTGATHPESEHVWAALVWDPAGVASTVLAAQGHDRRRVLDGVGRLGRLVPEAPSVNPLPGPAEQEALAIGHGFTGDEHLLLAMLAGEPDDLAGRVLRDAGLSHAALAGRVAAMFDDMDRPLPTPVDPTGAPPNPRLRQVFAAAQGLSATLGDGVVRSTDGLIAYLWQDDGQQHYPIEAQGSSGPALVAALVEIGVRVPEVPVPEPDREPWGEWVTVPEDRVDEVEAVVEERHPARPGWVNCIGSGDRVIAKAHVNLQAIVDEVLATGRAIPPSAPPPA